MIKAQENLQAYNDFLSLFLKIFNSSVRLQTVYKVEHQICNIVADTPYFK